MYNIIAAIFTDKIDSMNNLNSLEVLYGEKPKIARIIIDNLKSSINTPIPTNKVIALKVKTKLLLSNKDTVVDMWCYPSILNKK